jgi:hypothetical protein
MVGPFTVVEIVGALAIVCLILFAILRSDASERRGNAVFAGLTGVILTILLSIRFYLLPTMEEDLRLQNLGRGNADAIQLFDMLSRAPVRVKHPLMDYILRMRLSSLDEYYDRAIQGRFMVDQGELPIFLLAMIRSATKSIAATSYAQPASWWDQPWGKVYERENEEAVKRHVSVVRTFIFANEAELNSIRPLLGQEVTAGIAVRYAFVTNLHGNLVNGLVCIDDGLAGELHLTPEKGIKEAEFFTRPIDIGNIRQRIERVQADALILEAPAKGRVP